MSVGFAVSCNACGTEIARMKNLEKGSFEEITRELEKVTDGFIGENAGQAQIGGIDDMLALSGIYFNCDEHCQAENYRSKIRATLKKVFNK